MLSLSKSALLAQVIGPMRNAQSFYHKSPVFINGLLKSRTPLNSSPNMIATRGIADENSGMDQNVQKLSWEARQEFWQKNKNAHELGAVRNAD